MIGTDIIEVSRIEKLIKEKGNKFLNRIYTQNEIDYCESKGPNKYQYYAGRFAAKEAVFKAIGHFFSDSDIGPLKFKDIGIRNQSDGSPIVDIASPRNFGGGITISISHIKKYATAVAYMSAWPDTDLLK